MPEDDDALPEPVEIHIDGVLDLHSFHPREVKALLNEYLRLCREKQILDVKIIHGKGTGALGRSVRQWLSAIPEVESVRAANEADGGWGAVWVRLRPPG